MDDAKRFVESKISPIDIEYRRVEFFETTDKVLRTSLTVNSLELGVLNYESYRFVARRSKLADQLTRRHLKKLLRKIPDLLEEDSTIDFFTLPVYVRSLFDGGLKDILAEELSLHPEASPSKLCIELSADMLYEDLETAKKRIAEIREFGIKIAIFEVGDSFCPIFRLSELDFDLAFLDSYSVDSLATSDREKIAGSLTKYLHCLGVKVFTPHLDSPEKLEGARLVGIDGHTLNTGGAEDGQ